MRFHRAVIVGETLRAALNSLALVVPQWLGTFVPPEWHARYDHRVEETRLRYPTKRNARPWSRAMGSNGWARLRAIYSLSELQWLEHVPAVQTLRKVWIQQFEMVEGCLRFRSDENIPPPSLIICSPYDVEATYGRKRTMWWVGYKVHSTQSCDAEGPRLITHGETSRAGNGDVDVTPVIHQALQEKDVLPREYLTDTTYAQAKQCTDSRLRYGIDLIAPTRSDNKWQGPRAARIRCSELPD